MRNHFRAGLVGLALAMLLVLTTAAPIVSKQVSAPAPLQRAAPQYLAQQPPFDGAHRNSESFSKTTQNPDEVVARELVTMYRRKSLGTKIKEGIKHGEYI